MQNKVIKWFCRAFALPACDVRRSHRCLISTSLALVQFSGTDVIELVMATLWATIPLWPPNLKHMLAASILIRKFFFEFP